MRVQLGLACLVLLAACQSPAPIQSGSIAADPQDSASIIRYDSIHHPTIARNGMVVSQNRLASQIGRDILARGGNAVDAAVAVGFALAVTLPRAGNLAGSGFMLVHFADESHTVALDYRSAAPASATLAELTNDEGEIDWPAMTFGVKAAAVPGTVAALYEAWSRFGSLPWSELLQPARDLARNGIVVSHDLAFALEAGSGALGQFEASRSTYLINDGGAPKAGALLRQPDLAWTIEAIIDGGADAFYRGAVADKIIAAMERDGGFISRDDLAAYRVRERAPVTTAYRGHTVVAAPLVSAGGVTLIQMLNVLSHFSLADLRAGSAQALHLLAETMKRAAANRRQGLGDPDFVDVDVIRFIGGEIADQMAADIDTDRARSVDDIQAVWLDPPESRDTTHYSIVDAEGNAVSNTYTLGYSFGSGYVVEGTGLLLDNQIRNFSHRLNESHANAMAPGKRMLSTMTPTIVLDADGDVLLVTGTPGGSRIINVLLQIIVNVIDFDMNIAEATHQPRIHQPWRTPDLAVESEMSPDTLTRLGEMGHTIDVQRTMGSTQSILRKDGWLFGAADPRRPDAAAIGVDRIFAPVEKRGVNR